MSLLISPLGSGFNLRVDPAPFRASPDLDEMMERLWDAEQKRRGRLLTNGAMLAFVRREGDQLVARPTDYRHFIAQRCLPTLFGDAKLHVLAVSGLVRQGDRLLFGRRAAHLTQDAGRWELVPAGGLVPPPDAAGDCTSLVIEQCGAELEEETGIPRTAVERAEPFVLVEDPDAGVIDIGVELFVRELGATSVPSGEYSEVRVVPQRDAAQFCHAHAVIPVSRALLASRGLVL